MPPREVNWMFVDLNAYFATVEQELQPELRGRPIVVIPIEAESACCIAVSYQAKAYGIRTGISLAQARALCPQLQAVNARPRLYVEMHHRILDAIQRCIPVREILSCDEFSIQLLGRERELSRALEIAYAIKQELRALGGTLSCSIGLGPNRLLAKMAGEMQRPDGLMVLERGHLPQSLYALPLSAIPGAGRRMEKRLRAAGIHTMRELCELSRELMSALWGGVLGDRLWLCLRGEDFPEPAARTLQTLSRQHILPPACRNREAARGIALKLLLSTARKMRRYGLWARGVALHVGYQDGRVFELGVALPPTQDAFVLQAHMSLLYDRSPALVPSDLAIILSGLDSCSQAELFSPAVGAATATATEVIDRINLRYGLHTVYPGSIHAVRDQAPTRVSFGQPPPLEEFDDPADPVRLPRKCVRRDAGVRETYAKPAFGYRGGPAATR